MIEVVFYETFSEEEEALKKHLPENIRAEFREATIQGSPSSKLPASLISIRTQSKVPDSWRPHLKGVLTRSSGYDHLREFMAESRGAIPCGYLPDYCARSVAEHAILVTLSLLKKLRKQIRHFDTFNRNDLTGEDCLNKNLLVVGVGKIGREIVNLGKGVGMNVKGVDIEPKLSTLEYVSLEEGLASADVVICALPLTEDTNGLLDYENLLRLKKGAVIINISRGEITPLADLARLLSEGVLGGISLDVFEQESSLAASLQDGTSILDDAQKLVVSLKDREDVIFTPHNAFNSKGGLERKAQQSCLAVKIFSETGRFPETVPENFVQLQGEK